VKEGLRVGTQGVASVGFGKWSKGSVTHSVMIQSGHQRQNSIVSEFLHPYFDILQLIKISALTLVTISSFPMSRRHTVVQHCPLMTKVMSDPVMPVDGQMTSCTEIAHLHIASGLLMCEIVLTNVPAKPKLWKQKLTNLGTAQSIFWRFLASSDIHTCVDTSCLYVYSSICMFIVGFYHIVAFPSIVRQTHMCRHFLL